MDCDVAVLGGGPGGYPAAIRAAQPGARAVCMDQEPVLGSTCRRVAWMPTQAEVPLRVAILRGGVLGSEFASSLNRFGSEVTVIEMLPRLLPMEDEDASAELAKRFGRRGIALHLGKQCTRVEQRVGQLTVHF